MISVVVPVFNTPLNLLHRCILSIQEQSFPEWEIIIVNDGSTDYLEKEIKSVCNDDSRVCILSQNNLGVSAARNAGIAAAKGDYVAFVDGDDTISTTFFEESIADAIQYDADVVIGNIEYVPSIDLKQGVLEKQVYKGDEVKNVKLALLGIPQNSIPFPVLGTPCGRLYRTSIAKKVLFPEGVALCEDQIFNREFIEEVNCVVLSPSAWYQYYQNDFSAMHYKFNEKYLNRMKKFWTVWNELNNREKDVEVKKYLMKSSLSLYMSVVRRSVVPAPGSFLHKRAMMRSILREKIFCDSLNELTFKDVKAYKDKIILLFIKHKILCPIYIMQKVKYNRGCR